MKSSDFEKEIETFYSSVKADGGILSMLNHLEAIFRLFLLFLLFLSYW